MHLKQYFYYLHYVKKMWPKSFVKKSCFFIDLHYICVQEPILNNIYSVYYENLSNKKFNNYVVL